ncbi:hypothetical protein TKK_0013362 [Trichogramma kaykai]|uniref:DNA-directed RNA polymerase I subunit RPA43 n=1 Tax=Trichogramma kaykai TaxID=54128 RepID=A0ABD2WJG1_9HYME
MKNNKFERENIVWTNLELKKLIEDENSCVKLVRAKKHLGLLPYHLNDLNASLKESMKGFLYCYDRELGGSLLAFQKGKLLTNYGDLMGDSPFIHIDIEADFYIFQPKIGKPLKGVVNKVAPNHIGLLVHKGFNASIPKPFGNDKEWIGNTLSIDQEVAFTPTIINFNSKCPYIRGTLNESEYNFKHPKKIVPKIEFESEEEQVKRDNDSEEEEPDERDKDSEEEELVEQEEEEEEEEEGEQESEQEKETNKKILTKIKKEIKEEMQEETQAEIQENKRTEKKGKKESKKRKQREEVDEGEQEIDKRKKRRIS